MQQHAHMQIVTKKMHLYTGDNAATHTYPQLKEHLYTGVKQARDVQHQAYEDAILILVAFQVLYPLEYFASYWIFDFGASLK